MELKYVQGKIAIENKIITTLDKFVLNFTKIPNIELKFVKDDFDNYAIDNRLEVVLGEKHLFISPIELQIPYKLYLSGDKDIEDAMYLWDIFRGKIEVNRLRDFMNALNVRGEEYGIEV